MRERVTAHEGMRLGSNVAWLEEIARIYNDLYVDQHAIIDGAEDFQILCDSLKHMRKVFTLSLRDDFQYNIMNDF